MMMMMMMSIDNCPWPRLDIWADMSGLKMQDRKRKDQKRTIVGKCRIGKWRNKFGVNPEGGKCGTGKWRTGNCRTKYLR